MRLSGAGFAVLLAVAQAAPGSVERHGLSGNGPADRSYPILIRIGGEETRQRARTGNFDASAEVACAQIEGQPLQRCTARVARAEGGDATVVVTFANGFARSLHFEDGAFIRANAPMSGVGTDTDWRLGDGLHVIRVDDQRFEIPHALVTGE